MLDVHAVAAASGLPESQIFELTKRKKLPAHLIRKDDGKTFTFAPVTLAFLALVVTLRAFFGTNSALPLDLANAAIKNIERLWNEGVPPGARLRIYVPDAEVEVSTDFIGAAKAKLQTVAT